MWIEITTISLVAVVSNTFKSFLNLQAIVATIPLNGYDGECIKNNFFKPSLDSIFDIDLNLSILVMYSRLKNLHSSFSIEH